MLTNTQKLDLETSILNYNFPCVAYDFNNNTELEFESIVQLESHISKQLKSQDITNIKDGLSNVLYWGYARFGYRNYRVDLFRSKVTELQLKFAKQLFETTLQPSILSIKSLSMPQFSGISFISKVCMFLNPKRSAVLDLQIMKMKFTQYGNNTILNNISYTLNETGIRSSNPNSIAYTTWCNKLLEISNIYYNSKYRAVDIERGFFVLIESNQVDYASRILVDA